MQCDLEAASGWFTVGVVMTLASAGLVIAVCVWAAFSDDLAEEEGY